jgi:hypothetical protein
VELAGAFVAIGPAGFAFCSGSPSAGHLSGWRHCDFWQGGGHLRTGPATRQSPQPMRAKEFEGKGKCIVNARDAEERGLQTS